LEGTKSVQNGAIAQIAVSENENENKPMQEGEGTTRVGEEGISTPRKIDSKWIWIAGGLVMSCLALFAMLSALNQPGIRTLFENNNASDTDEGFSREGSPSSLIDEAKNEVDQRPDDPDAHLKLADAFHLEGMKEGASREYIQAGTLFLEQDRVEEAVKALNEAIILQGGLRDADPAIVEKLVEVLFISAPDKNLASTYTRTSDKFSNWDIVKICEARSLLYNGDLDQAQLMIDEILRKNEASYLAQTVSAEITFMMGKNQEALVLVNEIQSFPNLPGWLGEFLNQFEREIR